MDFTGIVICDICSEDHTLKSSEGGMVFGGSGVCQTCTERMMPNIEKYNEEDGITAKANPGESFRDFSLRVRNGNHIATIYKI